MAYKQQSEVILAGSLNLLTPNDLVGDADSIALHNWRVDVAGALRSRQSATNISPNEPAAGYTHTIFRWGNQRYYGSGTGFYKGTSLISNSFDGTPLGVAALNGNLYVMNQGWQIVTDGTNTYTNYLPIPFGTVGVPTASAGGSLVDGVQYTYYVTQVTADGKETNPFAGVNVTVAAPNFTLTITRPAATDARIAYWNVYRIGNSLPNAYRVNQTRIPIATATFVDTGDGTSSDVNVTRLGIPLEDDHDPQPACAGLVGPYYGRMIAFNSSAHPNWIYWTPQFKPEHYPGSGTQEGNHAPVGDDADEIVAITIHPRHLRIYKKRSIWRLIGDLDNGILEQTNAETGLIGRKAICSQGGFDYFQSEEGIYVSDGDRVRKLSPKLDPLFLGVNQVDGSYPASPINADETVREKHCMAVKNGRLYFSYCDAAHTAPNTLLVCHLETGRWASQTSVSGSGYTALYYEGNYGDLLGSSIGITNVLEYGSTAEEIPLNWVSGYHDQGHRDHQKTYADVVIDHSVAVGTADRSLTVSCRFNNGTAASVPVGSIAVATAAGGLDRVVSTFKILVDGVGVTARNIAIAIDGNCNQEVVIYSATVHYYEVPRDALTFDTDEQDLGYEGVKGLEAVILDIDAGGVVTYDVRTDLPGNAMASRNTATVGPTSGRRSLTIPLHFTPEGYLARCTFKSDSTFRMFGPVRLRYRRYGEYIDGVNGEWFETQEIGIAI